MNLSALFSNMGGVKAAALRALQFVIPPAPILPSKWAEENIVIPAGNAIPGKINFDNAPYQRGMVDVIAEPGIKRVTMKTGAQLGKTTTQQCHIAYGIAHDPKSQIFVQPTQGDVQTFMETKLRPMLDANPSISDKMAKQRGRKGVNNSRIISYIGGWLMFAWAGSPKTLRGRSAPWVHADEIDGMDATNEGDPVELLAQRAATFGDAALRTESSTPTVIGVSRVHVAYEAGDQREYEIPCPHCQHLQVLRWSGVRWPGRHSHGVDDWEEDLEREHRPEEAVYHCESCGMGWDDAERIAAIRSAEKHGGGWRAKKPFKGHASFHAPEMLSTFRKLGAIVQSYLDKIEKGDIQVFVNVALGEAYEEKGDKADPDALMARREEYYHEAPEGVVYITMGVDMQMDRLEAEIVGWGVNEESWSLSYRVLHGDPLGTDVWDDLDELLDETFQHPSGYQLPISATCLDTGGTKKQGVSYTQRAYEYLQGKTGRRIWGIKGMPGWGRPIVEKSQKKFTGKVKRKIDLFLVGVDEAKLMVYRRLIAQVGQPGYCHFPMQRGADWFKGLTIEKLVTRYDTKGISIREWIKPDKARNEPLDTRVYATAALKIVQPSFKRLAEKLAIGTGTPVEPRIVENAEPPPLEASPREEVMPENLQNLPKVLKSRRTLGGGKTKGAKRNYATNYSR